MSQNLCYTTGNGMQQYLHGYKHNQLIFVYTVCYQEFHLEDANRHMYYYIRAYNYSNRTNTTLIEHTW